MSGATTARVLTARGRGAVAVIEVRGESARTAIADLLAESGQPPLGDDADRPRLRRIGGEEVVILAGATEATGVEVVELHCHGGTAIVEWVLDHLRDRGVSVRDMPDRNTGNRSLTRAQAAALLPFAPTVRTAEALLNQDARALDCEIEALRTRLSDDPDEAAARLRHLIARAAIGTRLLTGHTVVLAGPPNVGKSALFNALIGFERAIVSPRPGTTRDALRARLALRGWPIELIDTAGLHETTDPLDRQGVGRTRSTLVEADLILHVIDLSRPYLSPEAPEALSLCVASKADLPPAWNPGDTGAWPVSSTTGAGLPELIDAILDRLGITPETLDGPLAVRPSQVRHLNRALHFLEHRQFARAQRVLSAFLSTWPRSQ